MHHTLQVEDTAVAMRAAAAQLIAAAEAKEALDGPDPVAPLHLYDWLNNDFYPALADGCEDARFVLDLMSRKAVWKHVQQNMIDMFQLYGQHRGKVYRVVMASSLGDIGITDDFASTQYQKRVMVDQITKWFVLVRPHDSVNVRTAESELGIYVGRLRAELDSAKKNHGEDSPITQELATDYKCVRQILKSARDQREDGHLKESSKKDRVRKMALKHGFKLKEQPNGRLDLNNYVYTFAYALMDSIKDKKESA